MSKNILNLFCSLLLGAITFLSGTMAARAGITLSEQTLLFISFLITAVCYITLMPSIFSILKHWCSDYDWAEECGKLYMSIPKKLRQSFWTLFGFINLAFLFHTIHFMWGNEDWGAVRYAVDSTESLRSGNFSAYWLQELIFDGKILPVANNLWAFAGLSLAGILLAVYWNLPQRATPIVITGLLFAVTPYTLAVLYFVKFSLGVCWLPALALTALLLSEKHGKTEIQTYLYNTASVLLFLGALGTYMPIINFIAVAILGQILLKTVYADISIRDAARRVLQGIVNFSAALMIYWLVLFLLKETGRLDEQAAQAVSISRPLTNILIWVKYAFSQFALPLPFMDKIYKIFYIVMALTGLFAIIYKAPNAKASARGLILVPLLILATLLSLLFSGEPEINFARMSFFGLPFLYALSFVLLIKLGGAYLCRISYVLAVLLIFMNFVRVAYAEKVWKFGWDAETKLAERIITRLERLPEFNIEKQYKLLQIGEKSLRPKYYQKSTDELPNGELLNRAYYPQGNSKEAYNFFYQTDFLKEDAKNDALQNPRIREYLLNQAKAWPAKESLFISGDYIVIILDTIALSRIQKELSGN